MEALRAAEEREKELCCQLTSMKVTMENPGEVVATPMVSTQAFCAQPFSKEIDGTPISQNFRKVVVEPFDGTQDPHTHLQAFQIDKNDPLSCNLFLGTLRGVAMHWLATLPPCSIKSFNDLATSFTSQFMANRVKRLEAFQKGLCVAQFSDSLAWRRPQSMEETRTFAEKYIEVEED
ncbi:hypothetical protein CR513_31410, partial [Mucuna pruriens]